MTQNTQNTQKTQNTQNTENTETTENTQNPKTSWEFLEDLVANPDGLLCFDGEKLLKLLQIQLVMPKFHELYPIAFRLKIITAVRSFLDRK
jgi:hypothetical protein